MAPFREDRDRIVPQRLMRRQVARKRRQRQFAVTRFRQFEASLPRSPWRLAAKTNLSRRAQYAAPRHIGHGSQLV